MFPSAVRVMHLERVECGGVSGLEMAHRWIFKLMQAKVNMRQLFFCRLCTKLSSTVTLVKVITCILLFLECRLNIPGLFLRLSLVGLWGLFKIIVLHGPSFSFLTNDPQSSTEAPLCFTVGWVCFSTLTTDPEAPKVPVFFSHYTEQGPKTSTRCIYFNSMSKNNFLWI